MLVIFTSPFDSWNLSSRHIFPPGPVPFPLGWRRIILAKGAKSFRRQIWSRVVTSKAEAQGPELEEVVAMQKSQNIKGLPAISKFSGHPPHTGKLWGSNGDSGTSSSLCQHFILFMKVLWTFRSQNIRASGEEVYMSEYVHFKSPGKCREGHTWNLSLCFSLEGLMGDQKEFLLSTPDAPA